MISDYVHEERFMTGTLGSKIAIITGAGTGIGEAIAHKFAARRADFTQTLVQRCHVTLRIFPAYSFPRCDLDCTATSRSASTDVPRRDGVNRA